MTLQEIAQRKIYSEVLGLLVQVAIFDGFILMLKFFSWHPFVGVKGWFAGMFSLWSFFYHLVLCFSLHFFAGFHSKFYEVEQHTCRTRWDIICQFFSIQRIYNMILLCLLGFLSSLCYLGHVGIVDVQKSTFLESIFYCNSADKRFFLLCNGIFTGALFSWKYYNRDWYLLKFELVPPQNISTLATKVSEIVKESAKDVVVHIYIYYICYLLFCPYLASLLSIFSFSENLLSFRVSLYNIIDLKLLVAAVFTSSLMHITWRVFIELFNLIATKKIEFPICSNGSDKVGLFNKSVVSDVKVLQKMEFLVNTNSSDKAATLSESLVSEVKILQYLSFMDLRWLSQFSPQRRKMFFEITQPGGHPKKWSALSSICIKRLSEFHEKIERLVVEEKGRVLNLQAHLKNNNNSADNFDFLRYIQSYVAYIKEEELPDSKAIQVFTTCQPEIWTIEALGFILSAAYTEDKFGVVQKNLSKLIGLLIDLKLCEEKLPINVMSVNKYAKDSRSLHKAIAQRQKLKSAIESALYRIVLAYKTDIRAVTLSHEHHTCLEKYLEFRW